MLNDVPDLENFFHSLLILVLLLILSHLNKNLSINYLLTTAHPQIRETNIVFVFDSNVKILLILDLLMKYFMIRGLKFRFSFV